MTRPRRTTIIAMAMMSAVGFIVLRALYRAVFGGASGGETLLWSLPRVRLSGPFSHIVLFGPVSLEGLQSAVVSAFPFAGVILLTGIAVALVDPRGFVFLIPRVTWGQGTFVAFVIAVSIFPGIAQTATRTRYFAKLRGITNRRVLFLPFFEKTLEQAVGIAQALDMRGLGGHGQKSSRVTSSPAVVAFEKFSVPSRGIPEFSWEILPSTLVLLTGGTGCGKTTLLESIAGVVDHPHPVDTEGTLRFSPQHSHIAYVPHDPRSVFLAGSVVDEVALGLVLAGSPLREAREASRQALEQWGLVALASRHPSELSEGESVRVALASAFVTKPSLVLLDEPLAVLDRAGRAQVLDFLAAYVRTTGASVVMTDHGQVDHQAWTGECVQLGPETLKPGYFAPPVDTVPARQLVLQRDVDVVFSAESLSIVRGGLVLAENLDIAIRRGESLVVVGDNGAGKTTLLHELVQRAGHNPSVMAFVPTDPAEMFVAETVRDELAFTDKYLGLPPGFTRASLESLLPGQWRGDTVERMMKTHPRDVSRGQQTALAIALQMSHKPLVLALDEPTRGLDAGAREALGDVLLCVRETGTAIISASHDDDFASLHSDRILRLSNGLVTLEKTGVSHV